VVPHPFDGSPGAPSGSHGSNGGLGPSREPLVRVHIRPTLASAGADRRLAKRHVRSCFQ